MLLDLERLDDEESLKAFLRAGWRYIDPAQLIDGWYLDAIAEHFEAITDGQIKRLIINQPPRTLKSSFACVAWPAWVWAQPEKNAGPLSGPKVQWMYASYASRLSLRDSVKTRRLIESPWYQARWGDRFKLTSDQNTKSRFDNDKGGYRIATSVDGYATGEGAQIIVVDDPHNTTEAESDTVVESTIEWWDETLSTRLNDPKTGAFVVVMQRQSERDLTDHILSQNRGEWTHLSLPMHYDPARHCVTVLGIDEDGEPATWEDPRTEEGELLCPDRYDDKTLAELEIRLGPYGAAGQLEQSPQKRGGSILKREWWQLWSRPVHPKYDFVLASLDTNQKQTEKNDWNALSILGIFQHEGRANAMLSMCWRSRLELNVPKIGDDLRKAIGLDNLDLCAFERDRILNAKPEQILSGEMILSSRRPKPERSEILRGFTPLERARVLEKIKFLGLVDKVACYCDGYHVDRLIIENKANGFAMDNELRVQYPDADWIVELIDPEGKDKSVRAESCVPAFAAGLVWAPGSSDSGTFREWADGAITECAAVPNGKFDDRADTITHGIRWLRQHNILRLEAQIKAAEDRQRSYENLKVPKPLYPG